MNILNKNKKGQGLPLQTIVIAILVIIVLLVLIVFFVSKMGTTGSQIDDNTDKYKECDMNNPALSTVYETVKKDTDATACATAKGKVVPGYTDCCANIPE